MKIVTGPKSIWLITGRHEFAVGFDCRPFKFIRDGWSHLNFTLFYIEFCFNYFK